MGELIKKPWGSEEILEINDHYMVKRLRMKAGHHCSLQQHQNKHETFVIAHGAMIFTCEDENGDLKTELLVRGDYRAIPPGAVHRMQAHLNDLVYIEASTPHPDDVIRLEDSYGR